MKIFRFDRETGRVVDRYNSTGLTVIRVAHLLEQAMIQCAYLKPGGLIGYHQATVSQLFLVVQGKGCVKGESPEEHASRRARAPTGRRAKDMKPGRKQA